MIGWITIVALSYFMRDLHPEPSHYLQGTIGGREVGVQIDQFEKVSYLKYFYLDDKVDHTLMGHPDGTGFLFKSLNNNGSSESHEQVYLHHQSNESWEGYWILGTDSLRIQLKSIEIDLIEHIHGNAELKSMLNPYNYLRTSDMTFSSLGGFMEGNFKILWYEETKTCIRSFQVAHDSISFDELNIKLRNQQIIQIQHAFDCGSFGYQGDYSIATAIKYIDEEYLSLELSIRSSCFDQKVASRTEFNTYNVRSGSEVELEEVVYFSDLPVPQKNSFDWFKYRRNRFGEKVISILTMLYPGRFDSAELCDFCTPGKWVRPSWCLTREGLLISPTSQVNDKSYKTQDWFIIPYSEIEPYLVADLR
jgi:hypothetical protein